MPISHAEHILGNMAAEGPLNCQDANCAGPAVSERAFSQAVYDLARLCGWLVYRTPTFRRTCSTPGFPDMVLIKNGRLIFAELKTDKGKVSEAQSVWLDALERHDTRGIMQTHHYDVVCWRPQDWDEIEAVLKGEKAT